MRHVAETLPVCDARASGTWARMISDSPSEGVAGRRARADEVEPSEEMREADRANGEPAATDDDPSDGNDDQHKLPD